jgi:hypothetical protein
MAQVLFDMWNLNIFGFLNFEDACIIFIINRRFSQPEKKFGLTILSDWVWLLFHLVPMGQQFFGRVLHPKLSNIHYIYTVAI